jgi:broad specificity phosphatase PhoE
MAHSVVLARHGETEWSLTGRHTGKTDLPLTEEGRRQAMALGPRLRAWTFSLVLTSPLQRALETCRLAGYGDHAQVRPDLVEWDYGRYEGLTSTQIEKIQPNWSLWRDGGPGGEKGGGRHADLRPRTRAAGTGLALARRATRRRPPLCAADRDAERAHL